MAEISVEIVNKKGLHARAAAKFVKTVALYEAQVKVGKCFAADENGGALVGGSSILGLMMLGADLGSTLWISAVGAQAAEVLAALEQLIVGRFGEPD